ncbi:MAG: YdeI/OmpD-associated family protein [Solirubrobacteraceae bacterium]|nr:YdeI/OmpD-associated family protein [Solirubrobacteraceae bacterium]
MARAADDLPVERFADAAAFEAWLEAEHARAPGVWLELARKGTGIASVTYEEAVDVALCFGWIDGHTRSVDATWYRQRFTPRRPRSRWSKRNTQRAERLIAAGRMRPAGLAEVERAKADGRWDAAYHGPATMAVPPDLQAALDADPEAAASFAALDSRNRYSILYRLHDAKRPETRARRLAQFVEMLRRGETLH